MKRTNLYAALFYTVVWISAVCWAFWRWVPRVRVYPAARWVLTWRWIRAVETVCDLDSSVHDSNMLLAGECPADTTRTRTVGFQTTIGPALITWPRDA